MLFSILKSIMRLVEEAKGLWKLDQKPVKLDRQRDIGPANRTEGPKYLVPQLI